MLTSAPILTPEMVAAYHRDGVVKVSGLLTPEQVGRYHAAGLAATREEAQRAGPGSVFTQVVNVWQSDEVMRELALLPQIAELATTLAGIPLRLWHDHLLVKEPGNESPTEFHQDAPYWPFDTCRHALSCWIALCDVPVERGCMTFLPGTHELGPLPRQNLRDARSLFSMRAEVEWEPRLTIPLRAGDCTFHHWLVAHQAGANRTDQPRVAHATLFMDAQTSFGPIPEGHPVTDPLELAAGQPLSGPLFPRVGPGA